MPSSKPYRIERKHLGGASHKSAQVSYIHSVEAEPPAEDSRMSEIIESIKELRRFLEPSQKMTTDLIETYKREIAEVSALRGDMDIMKEAIEATKTEIASLHITETSGDGMRRVSGELDAVIGDTERATSTILSSTEEIETQSGIIKSLLGGQSEATDSIQEHVIKLYEACNFQDLTGQRITKIVRTLGFVESRLDKMIEVWGGIEAFKEFEGKAQPFQAFTSSNASDSTLLNGPKIDEDDGRVNQDDIDALFE